MCFGISVRYVLFNSAISVYDNVSAIMRFTYAGGFGSFGHRCFTVRNSACNAECISSKAQIKINT